MITFQKRILDNGLTVIAHRDSSTPMAAVNILYKVGSRNETPERTGFAHLFEHLMFGGSLHVPNFDEPIQLAGGENNAFTNNDYIDCYIALPKENIETALWVESDRMGFLDVSAKSFSTQKKVVIEEFSQRYLNQPYGDIWLLLRPLCYKVHPYQWATIGKKPDHITNATLDEVQAFYQRHFTPDNAILSIAADLPEQEIFELSQKWFGDIASGTGQRDILPVEPAQTEQRRLVVQRDVPVSVIYMAFHMAHRASREYVVCDVISDVLSNGTSSRLYQHLVKENTIFSNVNAYVTGEFDNGLFLVTARLLDGISPEDGEKALWRELEELQTNIVSDYELQKNKNKFEATNIFGEINSMNKAMNLAFFEYLGDAALINTEVDEHNSVTPEEVMATSQKLFVSQNSNILYYLAR